MFLGVCLWERQGQRHWAILYGTLCLCQVAIFDGLRAIKEWRQLSVAFRESCLFAIGKLFWESINDRLRMKVLSVKWKKYELLKMGHSCLEQFFLHSIKRFLFFSFFFGPPSFSFSSIGLVYFPLAVSFISSCPWFLWSLCCQCLIQFDGPHTLLTESHIHHSSLHLFVCVCLYLCM